MLTVGGGGTGVVVVADLMRRSCQSVGGFELPNEVAGPGTPDAVGEAVGGSGLLSDPGPAPPGLGGGIRRT